MVDNGGAPAPLPGLARYVEAWSPAQEVRSGLIEAEPLAALAELLGHESDAVEGGGAVPPLWHWVCLQHLPRPSELGADGHPSDGGFYPPLPARRRMFVGGRVRVERPLIVGLEAEVRTSLERAEVKQGRAGEMLLVTLRRVFSQAGAGFLVEEQDLMYRSGDPTSPRPAVDDEHRDLPASEALWQRSMATDPLSLFLFSALTSNAHRIHYDLDYARDVEGYFGLVVQGPLLVLSMVELGRQEMAGRVVREIDFRLKSPVFSGDRVRVEGLRTGPNAAELSVVTHRSPSAATASLKFF